MNITNVLWQEKEKLLPSFHISVILGMHATWQRCISLNKQPEEPDFVGGLVLESTPLIYSALKSILQRHRISISVSGIYCHQTPQVAFSAPQNAVCELGDILFVYVHTSKSGQCRRNALLFQAKASSKQPYHIRSAEHDQLCLYTEWPDFVYQRSSHLNGQRRSVTPKSPHAGAQYLLIDDRPFDNPDSGLLGFPSTYPVGCCMPDELLYDHNHLASELFSLFLFQTGRPFEDRNSAAHKEDWSQVVWDLIESGVRKSFNRKNSGRNKSPRFTGDIQQLEDGIFFNQASSSNCYTTASDILGPGAAAAFFNHHNDIPPRNRNREEDSWEPEGGVSVVLIETSERSNE
ncbi:MAG: hypothetical protein HZB33_05780 [Nitrospirae bacterium]|nr:hypothetical protein [Nitrospirota bacterium]